MPHDLSQIHNMTDKELGEVYVEANEMAASCLRGALASHPKADTRLLLIGLKIALITLSADLRLGGHPTDMKRLMDSGGVMKIGGELSVWMADTIKRHLQEMTSAN